MFAIVTKTLVLSTLIVQYILLMFITDNVSFKNLLLYKFCFFKGFCKMDNIQDRIKKLDGSFVL
jgi:hypothetical protein